MYKFVFYPKFIQARFIEFAYVSHAENFLLIFIILEALNVWYNLCQARERQLRSPSSWTAFLWSFRRHGLWFTPSVGIRSPSASLVFRVWSCKIQAQPRTGLSTLKVLILWSPKAWIFWGDICLFSCFNKWQHNFAFFSKHCGLF